MFLLNPLNQRFQYGQQNCVCKFENVLIVFVARNTLRIRAKAPNC
jgi:hypothetical protein